MKALATVAPSQLLFDLKPFVIEGFKFTSRSVEAVGRPTEEQWQAAMQFSESCHQGSEYWIGDLLLYASSRSDWQERIDQLKSVTGLAHQTLLNRESISRHVAPEERKLAKSISYAETVQSMHPSHQRIWLERANTEGWKVHEFRNEIRASSRREIVKGQAVLKGMYRVIYADPPWNYRDSNATKDGAGGKASRHFPSMTMDEIAKLPVAAHAMKDSVLFMWVTTPMLFENPGPRDILEAWGFTYKSMQTWDKVLGMPGRFFQVQTEHLIVGERGNCAPDHPTPKPKSMFVERRSEEHSQKPTAIRKMIEKLYDIGPYLELFGREPVDGWSVFGNDARLWGQDTTTPDVGKKGPRQLVVEAMRRGLSPKDAGMEARVTPSASWRTSSRGGRR